MKGCCGCCADEKCLLDSGPQEGSKLSFEMYGGLLQRKKALKGYKLCKA